MPSVFNITHRYKRHQTLKLANQSLEKRVVKGALEFLIHYTDNSTAWLAADLVTDNLKAIFHVKQAQVKRRRQLAAKRIFKQGYLWPKMRLGVRLI